MIGIISLLLINYYNNRIEATRSGLKAVFYNRIGDVTILMAIILNINMYNDSNINYINWYNNIYIFMILTLYYNNIFYKFNK